MYQKIVFLDFQRDCQAFFRSVKSFNRLQKLDINFFYNQTQEVNIKKSFCEKFFNGFKVFLSNILKKMQENLCITTCIQSARLYCPHFKLGSLKKAKNLFP